MRVSAATAVEVLEVPTSGVKTREDLVHDRAAEGIETDLDGVCRRHQLAVTHDVPHRALTNAGTAHEEAGSSREGRTIRI